MTRQIIPIFIPFLGCPHDCAFCNQVKITNYKDMADENSIIKQIEDYLTYFKDKKTAKEIAFYGGSFTGLPYETMVSYLKIAGIYKKKGIIDRIRLSTRPDYINNFILDTLKAYEVDTIELGIQSFDDEVLAANERGHSALDSKRASKLIKDYGFKLGHQIMPGLYKDKMEKIIKTALESAKIKPDIARIYPTLVIKDTKLEKLYKDGLYQPLSLEEAVEISAEILMIFAYKDINVIRIGLQPTENINEGRDVVAGPFHAAMRQLVESYIYRLYLEEVIKKENVSGDVLIHAKAKDISLIAGNKKSNKKYFYDKARIKIAFVGDEDFYLESDNRKITLDLKGFIKAYVEKKYGGDLN
ncbi:elongator complex protein 3 [Anaerococcus lactolyticus]|uniref:elongator complex protein 3 n=1 Tax=Anaerococcus lactolyticus TaxID=33032 RepID=UPI00288A8E38|nr:radical SAM protein [Anaerococcus lactolyticus]